MQYCGEISTKHHEKIRHCIIQLIRWFATICGWTHRLFNIGTITPSRFVFPAFMTSSVFPLYTNLLWRNLLSMFAASCCLRTRQRFFSAGAHAGNLCEERKWQVGRFSWSARRLLCGSRRRLWAGQDASSLVRAVPARRSIWWRAGGKGYQSVCLRVSAGVNPLIL